MKDNIFRKTLIWIMNNIAYNTKDTDTVFMLLLAIWWGNELVNTDHVPIILAVLAIIFFLRSNILPGKQRSSDHSKISLPDYFEADGRERK